MSTNSLESQLREMDRQRDHLRAGLADAQMREELANLDRDYFSNEEAREKRKEVLREKIAKREARRAKEYKRYGAYVRPGAWDSDLDNYQESRYEEDVGDGYKVRLVRTPDLTWNGYAILPEGHCATGRHYDFFAQEAPAGLPSPSQYLTYGGVPPKGNDYRTAEVGVYGFYLSGTVKPRDAYPDYTKHNYFSAEQTGYTPAYGSHYVDYAKMCELCMDVVGYFKRLAADSKMAAICRNAKYCAEHWHYFVGKCEGCSPPKRSWAEVVAAK
jgi:hypothetical protein